MSKISYEERANTLLDTADDFFENTDLSRRALLYLLAAAVHALLAIAQNIARSRGE